MYSTSNVYIQTNMEFLLRWTGGKVADSNCERDAFAPSLLPQVAGASYLILLHLTWPDLDPLDF